MFKRVYLGLISIELLNIKWSAGCQVIAANDDFTSFMKICNKSKDIWGNSFTYTLIESDDLV